MDVTKNQSYAIRYNSREFARLQYRSYINEGNDKQEACRMVFDDLGARLRRASMTSIQRAEGNWARVFYKID